MDENFSLSLVFVCSVAGTLHGREFITVTGLVSSVSKALSNTYRVEIDDVVLNNDLLEADAEKVLYVH